MLEIDGCFGEGGGQILRTALALSAVKKIPCRVFNIRKGRPIPGLQVQHLSGLLALAELCNANLEGASLGSQEIKFFPEEVTKNRISIKIETAGSITLVLQTLIPVCLFAKNPVEIEFNGGATDTFFSPTIDYFRYVFLKILEKMGGKIEMKILKRGYYPSGEAQVKVKIYPSKLKTLNLIERGQLNKILIFSVASESLSNKRVAERQVMGARKILGKLKLPIEERIEYVKTSSPGCSICIVSEFKNTILGSDGLGKLGTPAEKIGEKCALQLLKEEKLAGCIDRFLTDQILPYMALTNQKSQVKIGEITSHTKTNIWVISQFVKGFFEIKENLLTWFPS